MVVNVVTFYFLGDGTLVLDSIWTNWEDAQRRVEALEDYAVDIVGITFEPVSMDAPGYSKEELE